MIVIFEKDQLAQEKKPYYLQASALSPVTLQVDGDLDTDEITIKGLGIDGEELTDLYDMDGELAVLSKLHPVCSFDRPIRMQLNKPAGTTNAIGLMEIRY